MVILDLVYPSSQAVRLRQVASVSMSMLAALGPDQARLIAVAAPLAVQTVMAEQHPSQPPYHPLIQAFASMRSRQPLKKAQTARRLSGLNWMKLHAKTL